MPASLSRDAVREIDRRAIEDFGIPGLLLMENAGRGIADLVLELAPDRDATVVVCCGKGNNGGDGFVVARRLDGLGRDVRVLLFASPNELGGDAAFNHGILERTEVRVRVLGEHFELEGLGTELAGAEVIVDALLGTGTRGSIRAPFDAVIEAINAAPVRRLAVDLPSGLDCDSGEPLGPTVRADVTATMAARKLGFDNPSAAPYVGHVEVVDLGIPRAVFA